MFNLAPRYSVFFIQLNHLSNAEIEIFVSDIVVNVIEISSQVHELDTWTLKKLGIIASLPYYHRPQNAIVVTIL